MKISEITVDYINHMGNDLSVVNAARVSFHKESTMEWGERPVTEKDREDNAFPEYPIERIECWKLRASDEKLINYLAKHKHFSPFNHTFLTFKIKAPIFVARQLQKHRFMPWNEVSRRYVDEEPEFYIPKEWRGRPVNSKQGSDGILEDKFISLAFRNHLDYALVEYNSMLQDGVAPEQARMALPQAMMTEWWWSGTLGAYADMLRLRLDPHTQYESRIVANLIHKEIQKLFPISIKALLND